MYKKTILEIQYRQLLNLYHKLHKRLSRYFLKNRFHLLSKSKRTSLLNRIGRLKDQIVRIEASMKWTSSAAVIAMSLYAGTAQAQFTTQGTEFRVNEYTTNQQGQSDIALDSDGDFVVVWSSFNQDGSNYGVYGKRYNASGVGQGSEFQVNSTIISNQRSPSVAMDSLGNFVVVWQSTGQDGNVEGIFGQRYDASGVTQGSEFQINSYTTGAQFNPSIAMDRDGDFVVVCQSNGQDLSGYGIFGQRYNASGTTQGSEFQINTTNANAQSAPEVAIDNDGDFVVVWQSYAQDGNGLGIYGQRFNTSGSTQGSEFIVNTYTSNSQQSPSVAMDRDGDFVVVWQSAFQDLSGYGIYGQRYNASGVMQGSEFLVNTTTNNTQKTPSIAMDKDGDYAVVWSSYQNISYYDIYSQRYSAAGAKVGGEVLVNTYTTNYQQSPAIAMDADGDFVVVWQSTAQDGQDGGVYAQRYAENVAPSDIALSAISINENVTANSVIGSLSSTDSNTDNTFTYTLVSGTGSSDNSFFNISGTDLRITASPNFENKSTYNIRIRSTDQGGLFFEKQFTISINDLVETSILKGVDGAAITIYPNPASDYVFVNLNENAEVNVLDLRGNKLLHLELKNQQFSVKGLDTGMYLVEVILDGKKAISRLVVE